jgi:choline dehydrogenase
METDTFDFIVIGGGSAGCVVAGRLAESNRYRVLLIEAGTRSRYPWIKVPLGTAKLFENPRLNWCYDGEPERGLNNRRLYQPRGKLLGGTGAINGMAYVRGHKADFDNWRDLGNVGWGYDDVLPFFKANEDNEQGDSQFHATGGAMKVSNQRVFREIGESFIAAGVQWGSSLNPDFNGPTQEGFGHFQWNYRNGQRVNPADAYLSTPPAKRWLTIATDAHVTSIQIDNLTATAVEYRIQGEIRRARARREIILSAGTFNSPQILQLSGVGDAATLRSLGIAVIVDLPGVGQNYQDHMQLNMPFRCNIPDTVNDDIGSLFRKAKLGLSYLLFRNGPLSQSGTYSGGFIQTRSGEVSPDVQVYCNLWTRKYVKSGDGGGLLDRFSAFTLMACQLRPDARGTVRIKSRDPMAAPAITANAFQSRNDIETIVRSVRILREIANRPALKQYIVEELGPGAGAQSDESIVAYAKDHLYAAFHAVGTCRMGADRMAVVDERLRVRGIRGLRVIDASIMPVICSGNTHATTLMIGEKGANMILEDALEPTPASP